MCSINSKCGFNLRVSQVHLLHEVSLDHNVSLRTAMDFLVLTSAGTYLWSTGIWLWCNGCWLWGIPQIFLSTWIQKCLRELTAGNADPLTSTQKTPVGNFRGGPVAKTQSFQCRGARFNPWSGKWIPHSTAKSSYPSTKRSCMLQLRHGVTK